jgi:hypothetical protein
MQVTRREFLATSAAAGLVPIGMAPNDDGAMQAARDVDVIFGGLCAFVPNYRDGAMDVGFLKAAQHQLVLVVREEYLQSTGGGTKITQNALKKYWGLPEDKEFWYWNVSAPPSLTGFSGEAIEWGGLQQAGHITRAHSGPLKSGWHNPANGAMTAVLRLNIGVVADGTPTPVPYHDSYWFFTDDDGITSHGQTLTDRVRWSAKGTAVKFAWSSTTVELKDLNAHVHLLNLPPMTGQGATNVLKHFRDYYKLFAKGPDTAGKMKIPRTSPRRLDAIGGDPVYCPPAMF